MQFECDEDKNIINIAEHEIDFNDAWQIFDFPLIAQINKRKDYQEIRYVALGQLNSRVVVVIYTLRQKNIRLISIRRANRHERQIYQAFLRQQN